MSPALTTRSWSLLTSPWHHTQSEVLSSVQRPDVFRYLEKLPTTAARTSTVQGGITTVLDVPDLLTTDGAPITNGNSMGWVPPLPTAEKASLAAAPS